MEIDSNTAIKVADAMQDLFAIIQNQEVVDNGNKGLSKQQITSKLNNALKLMYKIQGEI
jgi:hypothetical protein